MNKNAIALPSLKKDAKLPVILNQQELKVAISDQRRPVISE
jgi:hypothetical protein